jgi:hypothetical protein
MSDHRNNSIVRCGLNRVYEGMRGLRRDVSVEENRVYMKARKQRRRKSEHTHTHKAKNHKFTRQLYVDLCPCCNNHVGTTTIASVLLCEGERCQYWTFSVVITGNNLNHFGWQYFSHNNLLVTYFRINFFLLSFSIFLLLSFSCSLSLVFSFFLSFVSF